MEPIDFYRVLAPFYDADYKDIFLDGVKFYVDLAREAGGPVLEMGCGTGRVLLPTARAGVTITGLELSPDMLAVLRHSLEQEPAEVRGRVTLVEGDARCTDAGAQFALITAPFRVAQHLLTRADQRAWLSNVRRHLLPGGVLCFDVFQINPRYLVEEGVKRQDIERVEPETGLRIRRFDTVTSLTALQILDIQMEWLRDNPAGAPQPVARAGCQLRWFTRGELENLFELEGFEIVDYWGSFERQPFGVGSTQHIIRGMVGVR